MNFAATTGVEPATWIIPHLSDSQAHQPLCAVAIYFVETVIIEMTTRILQVFLAEPWYMRPQSKERILRRVKCLIANFPNNLSK